MDGEKRDAATAAARSVVDLVSWDASSTETNHELAVIAFSSRANTLSALSSDFDQLATAAGRLP
jgi:hypothetical protein